MTEPQEAIGPLGQVEDLFMRFYRAGGVMDFPQFLAQDVETQEALARCATRVFTERAAAFAVILSGDDAPIRQAWDGTDDLEEADVVRKLSAALQGQKVVR